MRKQAVTRSVPTPCRLVRHGRTLRLVAPEGTFSYYHPDRVFTGYAWDAQAASLTLASRRVNSLLLLGLGGGTVARQCRLLFPKSEITGVECDARVLEIALRFFHLNALGIEPILTTAEAFLQSTRRHFDAILDDTWSPEPEVVKPILRRDGFVALARARLRAGGVYAVTVYSRSFCATDFLTALQELRAGFSRVVEVGPGLGQVTVLAAGDNLESPFDAYSRLQSLPHGAAEGLAHVRIRAV